MKTDTTNIVTSTLRIPPSHGPGSGKEAWKALALEVLDANDSLSVSVAALRETVRDLEAEIKLLREQIAGRKPKGGREPVPDEKVRWIEQAIEAGQSTRTIGERFRVSAMTVSRVRKRMQARQAQSV